MPLPTFRYHPDPIATGSVKTSDATCRCCGHARGYIYAGPIYSAVDDLDDQICPWCIADASAAAKFDAVYVDDNGIGGGGGDDEDWPEVSGDIIETITTRTPGFNSWQSERWFTCCDDGGAFLGPAGAEELHTFGGDAVTAIEEASPDVDIDSLQRDRGPTAYLFKCLHCGAFGGYVDTH